jgi:cell division transport system permease protein
MSKLQKILDNIRDLMAGDMSADKVVPPSGYTANLTSFSAGAMAFLAVFALALSLATGRLADRWSDELAKTTTIRISAPEGQMQAQLDAVLNVLDTTSGVMSSRVMSDDEQRRLLEPWFGPDLPLENLPIPRLVEVLEDNNGPDMEGLRLRLSAEAPGAVLDDHTRWRRPLVNAAKRLRSLGTISILLITGATAAMITLAAQSALAANGQVISVLRLVGARDAYIARAFVRRFTIRAMLGAIIGTVAGMVAILFLPSAAEEGAFLTGLGYKGWHWILPMLIPLLVAIVAFWATRLAALRALARIS